MHDEKVSTVMKCMPLRARLLTCMAALGLAATIWLPLLHRFAAGDVGRYFRPNGVPPSARALARRHLELWTRPDRRAAEVGRMRSTNAEWDFMGRTYLVLSLANMALRDPVGKPQYLEVMDRIIGETLRLEREKGMYHFLMDYAHSGEWQAKPERSIFVDGEIALMLGARRMVEERPDYRPLLRKRVDAMVRQMRQSPVLSGESYPDECWMFCNSVALAAMRVQDALDGTDHAPFCAEWVRIARTKLVDPKTGLLISSYTVDGTGSNDGPEGSSIWMVAHCLQVVDPEFAADQYARAKRELACSTLGLGYAREWPVSGRRYDDVDSGLVVPVLDLSPASSGLAFVGASSFEDRDYLRQLLATLNLGGFPVEKEGALRYCASNQVGDAVMLYATVLGPLWQQVRERTATQ